MVNARRHGLSLESSYIKDKVSRHLSSVIINKHKIIKHNA